MKLSPEHPFGYMNARACDEASSRTNIIKLVDQILDFFLKKV